MSGRMDTSEYVVSMGMAVNVARLVVGVNDLFTMNPELAAQWHPTKNGSMTPQNFAPRSHKKVWWVCSLLHEWEASIDSRSRGRGCSICAGKRILIGFNDLLTKNPELAAQWHPTKNGTLTPQNVSGVSGRKVWWLCPLFHEWEATIDSRSRGRGCSICAGTAVLVGFNDLAAVNPEIAAQWHPVKNGLITPNDVTANSGKKVWWLCSLLHEWETAICQRSSGTGCPICAGKLVLAGFNDLATAKPELAAQWHPTKNGMLTPQNVTSRSHKKMWWKCALDHEWEAPVSNREKGSGCPKCAGRIPIVGSTDLASVKPELAAEWHPAKNGILTPQHVTAGSNKKAWWLCSLFHEWETTVEKRFNGSGCPTCSAGKTENNFREAFASLSKLTFESNRIELVRLSRKFDRAQIDMLNDDLKLVIEYDGEWTHGGNGPEGKTLHRKLAEDKETTQALVDIGYKVIRIRDHSFGGKLPFIPLDAGYELSVFQIAYKSYGKDKDSIEALTRKIIAEKDDWFKVSNKVLI